MEKLQIIKSAYEQLQSDKQEALMKIRETANVELYSELLKKAEDKFYSQIGRN